MKRLGITLAVMLLCVAVPAMAQQTPRGGSAGSNAATGRDQASSRLLQPSVAVSSGLVTPTPEMWLYEQQLREYLDPGMAVRKNAEFRAAQRRHRMAALKWFGFSNQRPGASPDPYNGEYSPAWTGNNGLYPYRWSGDGRPWVVLRPGTAAY